MTIAPHADRGPVGFNRSAAKRRFARMRPTFCLWVLVCVFFQLSLSSYCAGASAAVYRLFFRTLA